MQDSRFKIQHSRSGIQTFKVLYSDLTCRTGFQDSVTDLNDVWRPSHLPYGANGTRLSNDRRIAAKRHSAKGSNILFLDGRAGYRDAKLIDIELFREKKL